MKGNAILTALAGKQVLLAGKFDGALKEQLLAAVLAHGGSVAAVIDATVAYVVSYNGSVSGAIGGKIESLRKKGHVVPVLDFAGFVKMVSPTPQQMTAMVRAGAAGAELLKRAVGDAAFYEGWEAWAGLVQLRLAVVKDGKFDGLDMSGFDFSGVRFEKCSFVGCKLSEAIFCDTCDCDFSGAKGEGARFLRIDRSRFVGADLPRSSINSHFEGSDFTEATLDGAHLEQSFWASGVNPKPSDKGAIFKQASLKGANLDGLSMEGAPNFEGADLSGAKVLCRMKGANCRQANFSAALMINCHLGKADLSGAKCDGATLAQAHLAGAKLAGASLTGCTMRGAETKGATFPRGFDVAAATANKALPKILAQLDGQGDSHITLQLGKASGETHQVSLTFYGKNAYTDFADIEGLYLGVDKNTPPNVLMNLANVFAGFTVDFGKTVVKASGTGKGAKEYRELVIQCVSEAFGQALPDVNETTAAMRANQKAQDAKNAADRAERAKEKSKAEKAKATEEKKVAAAISRKVGKVTDVASFLKALELRIEKPKIDKATKMLKASGFQLFNDVGDTHLYGVVKSQTDPDLVYACRVDSEGKYSCCTQNLNICGGLRGSICKHLLVLIIGLVQAGTLDPTTIDEWVAKTRTIKAELDKEKMGDIFIRYKSAEAGEVDWRPTETVPEDYYTL